MDIQELTPEQIAAAQEKENQFWASVDQKVLEISNVLKCRIYAIVLESKTEPGEYITGYARVPDLLTQLRLIDKASAAGVNVSLEACSAALDGLIVANESDSRISNKEDADYWKGACLSLARFHGTAILKKK